MIVEGLDPVDWAEFDGRKRRGRKAPAGKKAPAAKTARGKRGEERAPRGRDQAAARTREETRPRTGAATPTNGQEGASPSRSRHAVGLPATPEETTIPAAVDDNARDRVARAVEPEIQAPPRGREPAPRMRPPRNEPRRDEARPASREERPADHRRERYRQEDLGPAVVGFGDDIPAFMMVRRRPAPAPLPETDT